MQKLLVDSDLQVRMQQDNSINPSVVDTIFTNDMMHFSYTQANVKIENWVIANV